MNLKQKKRAVYVTLVLLLITAILLGTASYAWLSLATAPDVMGIHTNIGANGSLEIALLNGKTYVDPSLITSKIGGSLEANNPVLANVQWGNVLDLSDPSYGLGNITLIPARLDVSTENLVNTNLLTVPSYGEDGRFNQFNTSMASGVFIEGAAGESAFTFDPQNPGYGIRGIGTVTGISAQEAALTYARTAVKSYSASAEAASIRFWETHGEDFFYIVHRKGFFTTWEETEKAVETFYLMANDMLEILDLFDSALRQGMIGYLSSAIASEKEFNAIKEIIENKSIPLSSLFSYIPVSVPSLYTSCIGSLETDIRQMERIRGQYISYVNGVISLSQINMGTTMQGFMDTHKAYINGEIVFYLDSEFPLTEDNELTVLTHTPGYIDPYGEVLHSIPLYIGDYNAFFNYDGKSIEVVTLTESDEDPVLESISLALDALTKDDVDPMQAVNLNEVYGFVMDMAFRCNEESDLLLQTAEDFRVDGGSELIDFQGGGSYMRFTSEQMSDQQIVLMMDAIRVAFVDNQNNLLAVAKLNTSNFAATNVGVTVPLCLYEFTVMESGAIQTGQRLDDGSVITGLHKNDPTVISVVVWLDGDYVDNSLAAIRDQSMVGTLNLQFASSVDLKPAVPGNPADPNATKPTEPDATVPTQPDASEPTVPSQPTQPTEPEPSIPDGPTLEPTDFYLEYDGNTFYIYSLWEGERSYELPFTGTLDANSKTVVISKASRYPEAGLVIPALVRNTADNEMYSVSIDPEQSPFKSISRTNVTIIFAAINGQKVGVTSPILSDLFASRSYYDLCSINLSGLDTSAVTDMSYLFYQCRSLRYLNLSGLDTSNVTNMEGMFNYCSSLSSLDLSGLDTSKVTDMSAMFSNCLSLVSLDLSGFDTSNVTDMASMFSGCGALNYLNLSSFDMSKVTTTSYFFTDCTALSTVITPKAMGTASIELPGEFICIEDGNTYTVIDSTVPTKSRLEKNSTVTAEDGNAYYVKDIGNGKYTIYTVASDGTHNYTFSVEGAMRSDENVLVIDKFITCPSGGINLPAFVNFGEDGPVAVKINGGNQPFSELNNTAITFRTIACNGKKVGISGTSTQSMFRGTSIVNFANLDLSALDTSGVTNMGLMFSNCDATSLDLSSFDVSNVVSIELMFSDCVNLSTLDVSTWDTSNVERMMAVFSGCTNLTTLDVSDWDTSSATDMFGMFSACESITALDLSGWDTSKITYMAYFFSGCRSLATLDVSTWDTGNVTEMAYMFSDCSGLTQLDLGDWNTSNVTDMSYMFENCTNLTDLNVGQWDTSNVTNMLWMFAYCTKLSNFEIGDWDTSSVQNMGRMFSDCTSLTALDISHWDTSSVTSMAYMFYNCTKLTTLDAQGWNTSNVTRMECMFYNCSKLMYVDTSLWDMSNANRERMFYNCPAGN